MIFKARRGGSHSREQAADLNVASQWNLHGLLVTHVLALLLIISWLWTPTRKWWDVTDDRLFDLLNSSISHGSFWSQFWAIANMRVSDIPVAIIMGIIVIKRNFVFNGTSVRKALLTLMSLLILMMVLRSGFNIVLKQMDFYRYSPTLLYENTVRLSELFPEWNVKDSSRRSFPGDHASVILLWALFLSIFARPWQMAAIWSVAILAMMPRLVAGAHWGSDDFVGGLLLALFTFGWGYCTPYAAFMVGALEHVAKPFFQLLTHIPIVRRMAVIRE